MQFKGSIIDRYVIKEIAIPRFFRLCRRKSTRKLVDYLPYRRIIHGIIILYHPFCVDIVYGKIFGTKVLFGTGCINKGSYTSGHFGEFHKFHIK